MRQGRFHQRLCRTLKKKQKKEERKDRRIRQTVNHAAVANGAMIRQLT